MKDINETHPSLIKCKRFGYTLGMDNKQNMMRLEEDIQKHTTDNAVLKKAIERVCLQTGAEVTKDQLFIELGLEEK